MNDAGGIVDRQVDSMVRLLRRYEATEIDRIIDRAYATAEERLRAARRAARQRVHEAIAELRAEVDAGITRVRAGDQARARRLELEKARQVLAAGRDCLDQALRKRWQADDSRKAWVSSLLEQASSLLPAGAWQVEHAAGWPEEERQDFAAVAAEAAGEAPRLSARDDVAAGLRIGIGGASLDGTLEGLLARGSELEARLLAEYYRLHDEGGAPDGGES
jgi:vacuolar-type H+-ATPase subunit E/Vma4